MDEELGVSRYSGNCFDVADIKQEPVRTLFFLLLLSIYFLSRDQRDKFGLW